MQYLDGSSCLKKIKLFGPLYPFFQSLLAYSHITSQVKVHTD